MAGDFVFYEIVCYIKGIFCVGDYVVRIGGDEFFVVFLDMCF